MKRAVLAFFFLSISAAVAQDTSYARNLITRLTDDRCFGRGYLKGGLKQAQKIIVAEIKKSKAQKLFRHSYTQSFEHPVNVFKERPVLKIDGRTLLPGRDYIPFPNSKSVKGAFTLNTNDSLLFTTNPPGIQVRVKQKLTFGVATQSGGLAGVDVLHGAIGRHPRSMEVDIGSKLLPHFESRNIGCMVKGTSNSDSLVVITAHYDHLGGLGDSIYFPGANDNASGVSMALDLLRHYSKSRPRYNTAFIFFAGEEAGLLGSKFFVESGIIDLKKIKFLINLDLLGTGDEGIMVVNGSVHPREFGLLQKINEEKSLVGKIGARGKAANSDHYWFSEAGVPCFFIYTTGGVTAYHDIYDIARTLPLTDYADVFRLITAFVERL